MRNFLFKLPILIALILGCNSDCFGQANPTTTQKKTAVEKKEEYIPFDLNDAVRILKADLANKDLDAIKACKNEGEVIGLTHHGLGTGLRNSWGLWAGSRLAKWFNSKGVEHPDDMSGNILEALWCDLNAHPFSLEAKAKEAAAYWEGMKTPDNPTCPTCSSKINFTKWVLHKYSETNYVSFQYSVCAGTDKHVWLWNRIKGYRTYTDEKWKMISEAPEAFAEGSLVN